MKPTKLHLMATELAKDLKMPEDLSKLTAELTKIMVEIALKTELDDHLGYSSNSPKGYNSGNSRNGYSRKTLQGDHGEFEIETPRDRNSSFEPQLIKK
jgi:transposase-like protein